MFRWLDRWIWRQEEDWRQKEDDVEPAVPVAREDVPWPTEAKHYGGMNTIHQTGTVDICIDADGNVVQVWFRCRELPFQVSLESETGYARSYHNVADEGHSLESIEITGY